MVRGMGSDIIRKYASVRCTNESRGSVASVGDDCSDSHLVVGWLEGTNQEMGIRSSSDAALLVSNVTAPKQIVTEADRITLEYKIVRFISLLKGHNERVVWSIPFQLSQKRKMTSRVMCFVSRIVYAIWTFSPKTMERMTIDGRRADISYGTNVY